MTENIPDLGTQSDNSELLTERKLNLEYTLNNNFRNFLDCDLSQWKNLVDDVTLELSKKKYDTQLKDKEIISGVIFGSLIILYVNASKLLFFFSHHRFFSLSSLPSHLVTNHDHQGESIIHDGPNFGPYHLAHGDWFGMDIHPIPVIEV